VVAGVTQWTCSGVDSATLQTLASRVSVVCVRFGREAGMKVGMWSFRDMCHTQYFRSAPLAWHCVFGTCRACNY
jgi:hypothetical protein